jgi:hypothetical protein
MTKTIVENMDNPIFRKVVSGSLRKNDITLKKMIEIKRKKFFPAGLIFFARSNEKPISMLKIKKIAQEMPKGFFQNRKSNANPIHSAANGRIRFIVAPSQ